jgi:RluA family pseudouridine synthase
VDKPGNLLVHRAGRSFTSNLVYLVRNGMGCAATPQASSINRLDRETSGLVLFAKDERTLSVLGAAFRERNVDKEYVAVVHGRPAAGLSLIDAPIGRDSESAHGSRHRIDVVNGKAAQTAVLCCKAAGDSHSVLRLSPLTGRTHQLRLHCRHAGCPIVGDRWYGVEGGDALFHRPALHCLRLAFEHPSLRTRLTIEAPLPQELCGLVQRLSASAAQPQPSSCPH